MILVDYSAISIGTVVASHARTDENFLRHLILNNIRSINLKHRAKYGEMVLCMDHRSWRKDAFPNYKFKRGEKRKQDTKNDWTEIFAILNTLKAEFEQYLPYRIVHVDGAEGDDVIATLTERTQEFGQFEDVMIIAADKDYIQLQRYPNVKQWSTITKKMVKGNPTEWLHEAIVRGQAKDGIPNVKSDIDFFTQEGGRQKSITAKFITESMDTSTMTPAELERYEQNAELIDFRNIPAPIREAINNTYEQYETPQFRGLMNYFIKKRCANLLDCINDFKPGTKQ